MKLLVKCQRNGVDSYFAYEGLDPVTVTRLLTDLGATDIQFIDQTTYDAAVQNTIGGTP